MLHGPPCPIPRHLRESHRGGRQIYANLQRRPFNQLHQAGLLLLDALHAAARGRQRHQDDLVHV